MGANLKKSLYFSILATFCLSACGGGSTPPAETNETVTFAPPGTTAPAVSADVAALNDCGALPGQWNIQDLLTSTTVSLPALPPSTFTKAFRKSWGGTTTAYTTWKIEAGDIPVWNEGRRLHVDKDVPLTTTGMINAIALTGTPGNMTALVGTDQGLVIADFKRPNANWILDKQVTVSATGPVRSVAVTELPLEVNGPALPLAFVVANDAVLVIRLDQLRLNFGCMDVAYQAKTHSGYRPVKIVAQHGLATFLTASRLPEEFANADQFKSVLQKEWTSFQSTAHLIDLTRANPVEPFITRIGPFDRFLASDVVMDHTSTYFFGSRYNSANPAVVENGIASYTQLKGTPLLGFWSGIPKTLPGDYRMGRLDTRLTNATIRGLDRVAKVEGFLLGPTQQKWTAWKNPSPFDYVRSISPLLIHDKEGKPLNQIITTPQSIPGGPTIYTWEYNDLPQNLGAPATLPYASLTRILDATSTDVSYYDSTKEVAVFQHVSDEDSAVFPLSDSNDVLFNPYLPRIFHVNELIFFVRHSDKGPYIYVYKDTVTKNVDISKATSNPAVLGFWADNVGNVTMGSTFSTKAVAVFENVIKTPGTSMGGDLRTFRIDDIQEIRSPFLPQYKHYALLIHSWNGLENIYRVVILQMDLTPNNPKQRAIEIQGCSDIQNPSNNYSNNSSYGSPDDQPRFIGKLQPSSSGENTLSFEGFFQHFSPTYNVWKISINITSETVIKPNTGSHCKSEGDIEPVIDGVSEESVAANLNGSSIVAMHGDSTVRWPISAKTIQFLDVGTNILGKSVSVTKGQIWSLAGQYLTRMTTLDRFYPVALFTLDGSMGESCDSCQFRDTAAVENTLFSSHPERGIEFYDFNP